MYDSFFMCFEASSQTSQSESKMFDGAFGEQGYLLALSSDNAPLVDVSSNNDDGIMLLSATSTSYAYDYTIEDLIESGANVWLLSAGNSLMSGANTYWLFPDGATLSNVNGYLVNTGDSSITGIYLGSSLSSKPSDSVSSTFECVIYPRASYNSVSAGINSSGDCIVNSYIRYGPSGSYYIGTTSYVNVFSVVAEPALGSDFSSSELAIFGILAFSVLVSLVGVILRR